MKIFFQTQVIRISLAILVAIFLISLLSPNTESIISLLNKIYDITPLVQYKSIGNVNAVWLEDNPLNLNSINNITPVPPPTELDTCSSSPPVFCPPNIKTHEAFSITGTTADLTGNLVSTGGLDCEVWFEYGTSTAYGSSTSELMRSSLGLFMSTIFDLKPDTNYYFRACASNSKGTVNSAYKIFTTLELHHPPIKVVVNEPEIETLAVSDITSSSATLNGHVTNYGGLDCAVWFEYGESTPYDNNTPVQIKRGGPFTFIITNLQPDTLYYFTACANNAVGEAYKTPQYKTFKTLSIN